MTLFQRLWSRVLKRPANSPDPLEIVVDSAGESLAQIYKRQSRAIPADVLLALQPPAKKFFERHNA